MRFDESRSFNPGLARHQLVVLRPVKTKDEIGGDLVDLETFATVRAQVANLQGRELETVQQRWAEAKYRIRMQFTPGIEREFTLRWRLASGNIDMDILDVRDPVGASNYTEIIARDANAA